MSGSPPESRRNLQGATLLIDHVILTVADFMRSIQFYERALRPLGITDFFDFPGENGHPHLKGFGANGQFFFWLKEGEPRPDAVHVGFAAQSQAKVREFFDAAVGAGARIKRVPGPQLQYHADYFATWVLDPDGTTSRL